MRTPELIFAPKDPIKLKEELFSSVSKNDSARNVFSPSWVMYNSTKFNSSVLDWIICVLTCSDVNLSVATPIIELVIPEPPEVTTPATLVRSINPIEVVPTPDVEEPKVFLRYLIS